MNLLKNRSNLQCPLPQCQLSVGSQFGLLTPITRKVTANTCITKNFFNRVACGPLPENRSSLEPQYPHLASKKADTAYLTATPQTDRHTSKTFLIVAQRWLQAMIRYRGAYIRNYLQANRNKLIKLDAVT